MEKIAKNSKKIIFAISVILILLVALLYILISIFKKPSFEEIMFQPTKEINQNCPVMIDKETRFDSGVVLPNKVFEYNYTLINHDKSSLDVEGLKKEVEQVLINRVKNDPDLEILRSNKATIVYCYRDKSGDILFKISFTAHQYMH